ncbi:MAG: SLC13 family permease [Anaerolineae bacterium]|nr:SLC13 family permease [Anaerolineae bacterium]
MNSDMLLVFAILGITIVVFISDKLRVDIVALLSLLALVLTGMITTDQALAGFSNSTVIMIAGLFVVGAGLFRTGVADWISGRLLDLAGSSQTRLIVVLMAGAALLSGFLSNTGTVAVLLPAVAAAAWKIGTTPTKLLIPLAFAASMGGLITLIGSPPNLIIVDALVEAGVRPFGFFEFSFIGLPLLLVGIAYFLLFGRQLLPDRKSQEANRTSGFSLEDVVETYHLGQNLARLRVRRQSDLVNKTLGQTAIGANFGVSVVRIERGPAAGSSPDTFFSMQQIQDGVGRVFQPEAETIPGADTLIQANDILMVEGNPQAIEELAVRHNLGVQPADGENGNPQGDELLSQEIGLAELLITPRSELVGYTLASAHFAQKYKVQVLGVLRRGSLIDDQPSADIKLTFGDALLIRGSWQDIRLLEKESRNFVVVGQPAELEQPTGLTPQSTVAIVALIGMVLMMLTGVVSTAIAVIIAAVIMVLGGCVNMEQAYRAINWESVILIAAMLPMSTALENTGGAEFIADVMVGTLGSFSPIALMAGVFLLTTGFTQVISNSATAVLVAPIAIQAAQGIGVNPLPVMMMVVVGASSAFLTPIASPVNTLILTPGSYSFSDFPKVGLPLMLLFMLFSLLLVPFIWPL